MARGASKKEPVHLSQLLRVLGSGFGASVRLQEMKYRCRLLIVPLLHSRQRRAELMHLVVRGASAFSREEARFVFWSVFFRGHGRRRA